MAGKTAILALTRGGRELAGRLAAVLPGSSVIDCHGGMQKTFVRVWQGYERIICIMAAGIVVRTLAPLLGDKRTDPAVVVCDEKGSFAVSLLSGHLGGGNELAQEVAGLLGGQAVITTGSDVLGRTPLDLWSRELGLVVEEKKGLTKVMAKLVNTGSVSLYSDYALEQLPDDIVLTDDPSAADLVISCRTDLQGSGFVLRPGALVAGIGCNRNTPQREIESALAEACSVNNLALSSIRSLASIDLKNNEPGLLSLACSRGYAVDFYSKEQLNAVDGVSTSAAVLEATGAKGVAEPAALLASGGGRLLVEKMKWPNVTVAIAERREPWKGNHR